MEGAWGCGLMVVILAAMTLAPGSDHGSYESLPDGMHMMAGSRFMEVITSSYMVSIALYNYVGLQLCRKLSAVVWITELALYYGVSQQYGAPWTQYSYLEML